jgi:sugar-specific transcriptional regulator TrmB
MTETPIFDEDIPTYSRLLYLLRSKNSDQLIRNDSVAHASVLVANLVENAEKEILIYSSSFCKSFYLSDEVRKAFEQSSKKNIPLKVLIHYDLSSEEALIGQKESIKTYIEEIYKNSTFEYKFLNPTTPISFEGKFLNNFMVADRMSFRYEKSEPSREACISGTPTKTLAIGSINDKETANTLADAFHNAF